LQVGVLLRKFLDIQVVGEDGKTVNKYVGHEINNAVGKSYKEMMNENDKRK